MELSDGGAGRPGGLGGKVVLLRERFSWVFILMSEASANKCYCCLPSNGLGRRIVLRRLGA